MPHSPIDHLDQCQTGSGPTSDLPPAIDFLIVAIAKYFATKDVQRYQERINHPCSSDAGATPVFSSGSQQTLGTSYGADAVEMS